MYYNNVADTLVDTSSIGRDDLLKKTVSKALVYFRGRWLLCFSAFNQPKRRADPSLTGRGSFLKGHGCSSQTKHWLIALLFVGPVPVFVLHFSFV